MLNVHELERTWLRYKLKQFLPRIALGIVLSIAASIFYWSSFSDRSDTDMEEHRAVTVASTTAVTSIKSTIEDNTTIATPIAKSVPLPKAIQQPRPTNSSSPKAVSISPIEDDDRPSRILKPSIAFMDTIEDEARSRSVDKPIKTSSRKETLTQRPAVVSKPISRPVETKQFQEPTPVKKMAKKSTIVSEPKRSSITITAKQDEQDIKNVIKRFKKNKNPALSLFIARQYYESGRYQKAYNYALITNSINSDIEDSWLIFARSLVKLDQKEMAQKALTSYIDTSDSTRAKMLLDEIIHGDFR